MHLDLPNGFAFPIPFTNHLLVLVVPNCTNSPIIFTFEKEECALPANSGDVYFWWHSGLVVGNVILQQKKSPRFELLSRLGLSARGLHVLFHF